MKKIITQSILSVLLFLAVLFGFSRVDWISVFHIHDKSIEEKLGEL